MKMLILIIFVMLLPGCAGLDRVIENYEFGDITRGLIEQKQKYCDESNEAKRAAILFTIHIIEPAWIPVCDLLTLSDE